jgi:hypothetical protein
MSSKALAFAFLILSSAFCTAQEPAPESRAASRAAVEYKLESGLRVRLVPIDLPGELAVILGVRGAGILAEPSGAPHLAHISEHGIFHSLEQDPAHGKLVAKWFSEGRANAETLPDLMYFDLTPPADVAGGARTPIEIQRLRFIGSGSAPPAVMEREITAALSEVTSLEGKQTDDYDFLGKFAWSAFTQVALHGANVVPFKEKSSEISWKMVENFREQTFYPGNAMLTVVGDIDPEAVRGMINPNWLPKQRQNKAQRPPALRPGAVKGTWDVASHQLFMAWPAPPPAEKAHPALTLYANVLSGALVSSSQLRKLGRGPAAVQGDFCGFFTIQLPLKSAERGDDAAAEIAKVMAGMTGGRTVAASLKGARSAVRSLSGIGDKIEYPPGMPRKILLHGNLELWRMRATLAWDQSPEDYCARVDKVGADEILSAVKIWLAPEKAAIVTIAGKQ